MAHSIYFWDSPSSYGLLSNSANTPFTDTNGIVFKTADHYIMYHKAMLMHDYRTALRIRQALTPAVANRLGEKTTVQDEYVWLTNRERIMQRGLIYKCYAYPKVLQLLLSTGDSILYAAILNRQWGIGITEAQARNGANIRGLNLLGIAWMNVRREILHINEQQLILCDARNIIERVVRSILPSGKLLLPNDSYIEGAGAHGIIGLSNNSIACLWDKYQSSFDRWNSYLSSSDNSSESDGESITGIIGGSIGSDFVTINFIDGRSVTIYNNI